MIVSEFENKRALKHLDEHYDYVVVGGGMTGVCSAVTAARAGAKVALIQDRPVLGGNSSSEVRVWVLGATSHMGNNNRWSREGGVLDELMVENTYRNKEGNPVMWDMVLIDKVLAEPNITLYLNTIVSRIEKSDERTIAAVHAFNPQNATGYRISGKLFADCTGDGIVGYLAGVSYRIGAEEAVEFGEKFAPDKDEYGELMGHSILFYTRDTGRPVKYVAPDFALKNAEEQIPKLQNPNYFNVDQTGCKYWWLEYGGRIDTIGDTEKIKFEIWKVIYGVWDYIKNSGKFPDKQNHTLEWVGLISGKRESRRFCGEYMLTQGDIIEQKNHYDAVAFGGWSIDLHPADGVYSPKNGCNQWHSKGIYQIPYRCLVPRDLDNLFIGGRSMSSTHVANASTRVMCTAGHMGQASGMAAALCLKNGLLPHGYIDKERVRQLQYELIKTGQFIPGLLPEDETKLNMGATFTASSELKLDTLPAGDKRFRLIYPVAQLVPIGNKMPVVTMDVKAAEETSLKVELRSSSKPANFTPDVVDSVIELKLKKGKNSIELDFGVSYPFPRYAFVCFMTNDKVTLPMSDLLVSGLVSVFNHINPAVSNWGKQQPTEDIGVEGFEFWCPKRRPEGQNIAMSFTPALDDFGARNMALAYYRPYLGSNGWIPACDDKSPSLTLHWDAERTISKIILFFDTDFDHAMENVQYGHHDSAMPFCIDAYTIKGDKGQILCSVGDNHQSSNRIDLQEPYIGKSLTIHVPSFDGDTCRALMGIIVE